MSEPKRTPLFDQHVAAGGRMVEFAGYSLPVQYESIIAEHNHCREHCALFDTSHMGQLLISGQNAPAELSAALTQDAEKLPVGRGKYGFILTEAGTIIDDTILMRFAEDEYLLIVNAATCLNDIEILTSRLGSCDIEYLDYWAKLDIQGPESYDVLKNRVNIDLAELKYFSNVCCEVNNSRAIISRTGYTGELGYEIFMPSEYIAELWDKLIALPNVKPAGLGARDSLRLEMSYPLYGHELSEDITPAQADMEFFFDASREFVGRNGAIMQPTRKLVSLLGQSRRQFHPGDEIFSDGRAVGVVTSGAFSPSLNVAIGMGYVDMEFIETPHALQIQTARATLDVNIGKKPLYANGTCRIKIEKD